MIKTSNHFVNSLDICYVLHHCNAKQSLYITMNAVASTYQQATKLSKDIEPKHSL